MRAAAYSLCVLISVVCAALLFRGYLRTRVRLLLWSALFFLGVFVDNILLLTAQQPLDAPILSEVPALVGTTVLVLGLIWETR
jgi:hypothetical protein